MRSRFHTLVSNLSFSPGIASQMAFYMRRLSRETITRRLSVAAAIGMVIFQFAATIAPPASSNAASTNDMILGGIGTDDPKGNLLAAYDSRADLRAIFDYYQIDRGSLERTEAGSINSSEHDLLSIGRNPHSDLDISLNIPPNPSLYLRPLYTWGDNITYNALIAHALDGSFWFAVMYDCGNLVVKGNPPQLNISKATAPGYPAADSTVKPGDTLGYRVTWNNIGDVTANNLDIYDPTPAGTSFVTRGTGGSTDITTTTGSFLGNNVEYTKWHYPSMPAHASTWYTDLIVKVSDSASDGQRICNVGYIHADNMIILGLILLVVGYLTGISLLYYLGGLLLIVGIVLLVLGRTGRAVGGRNHWF